MKTFKEHLEDAKSLPSHTNGELNNHYVMFCGADVTGTVSLSKEPTPINVFNAMMGTGRSKYEKYGVYIKTFKTFRADGSTRPKGEWQKALFHHKKWERNDSEVTHVMYTIAGLKRRTTHLPAGVLIKNIAFIH